MTIPWQSMTAEEFAQFRCCLGEGIIPASGVFWRQVRPCFYRPALPFQEYPPQSVSGPAVAFLGGFQHAVPSRSRTNSFLNLIMCEDLALYSSDTLKGNERREIKRAGGIFEISLVRDITAFKTQAYPVYRSFYERTNYNYKAERRYEDKFSKWADTIFRHPKVVVLGAYKKDRQLGAVGVYYLVEGTLVYATFFCDAESLKMHAAGFMLHTVREAAAGCQAIKEIFIGNYKYSAAKGVDDFYLARGCKLVRKPAWLQLNPLAAFGLKRFAPQQYNRLIGAIPAARISPVNTPATLSPKLGNQTVAGVPKSAESDGFTPPAAHG